MRELRKSRVGFAEDGSRVGSSGGTDHSETMVVMQLTMGAVVGEVFAGGERELLCCCSIFLSLSYRSKVGYLGSGFCSNS